MKGECLYGGFGILSAVSDSCVQGQMVGLLECISWSIWPFPAALQCLAEAKFYALPWLGSKCGPSLLTTHPAKQVSGPRHGDKGWPCIWFFILTGLPKVSQDGYQQTERFRSLQNILVTVLYNEVVAGGLGWRGAWDLAPWQKRWGVQRFSIWFKLGNGLGGI